MADLPLIWTSLREDHTNARRGFRFLKPDDFGHLAVPAEGIGQFHLPWCAAFWFEEGWRADQNADRTRP